MLGAARCAHGFKPSFNCTVAAFFPFRTPTFATAHARVSSTTVSRAVVLPLRTNLTVGYCFLQCCSTTVRRSTRIHPCRWLGWIRVRLSATQSNLSPSPAPVVLVHLRCRRRRFRKWTLTHTPEFPTQIPVVYIRSQPLFVTFTRPWTKPARQSLMITTILCAVPVHLLLCWQTRKAKESAHDSCYTYS